jgi:3'-phosphoadenosine 5'-phosphosulfate synthase
VLEVIEMLEQNGIIPRAANDKISELYVPIKEQPIKKMEAEKLKSVEISKMGLQWLQVLSEGWASPLTGD